MKATILKPIEVNVKFLELTFRDIPSWGENQFADSNYNIFYGIELPFRYGDNWSITIDLDDMRVVDWFLDFDIEINMSVLNGCFGRFLDAGMNNFLGFDWADGIPYFLSDGEIDEQCNFYNKINLSISKLGFLDNKNWLQHQIKNFILKSSIPQANF